MSPQDPNVTRHLDADQLLDLVLGCGPDASRRAMLGHVAGCARCEQVLREIAASHERARSLHATGFLEAAPLAPGRAGWQPSRFAIAALALAASLAVVVGLFVALRPALPPSPSTPAVAWLPRPDPGILARGGEADGADSNLVAGLTAYQRHDLATARRALEAARVTGVMEQVRRVYLANTLLQLGAARPALAQLRSLDYAALPEPWRAESRWALGLALAGSGQRPQADSLLRQLAGEPGAVGDRARAELRQRQP